MSVAKEIEGMAMIWGDAVLLDSLAMFLGGIALVATPIVLGIFLGKTVHIVVTIGLGEDAGGSYGEILAVALYYCGVRQVVIWLEAIAVYYDCLGTHAKVIEGTVHGEDTGIEDVYLVDFLGSDNADSPGDCITLDYLAQGIAPLLGELLGVVEVGIAVVGREDDGGSIYTASKTTSSGLIATSLYQRWMIIREQ